jgi:two-component sensor histidine kinase
VKGEGIYEIILKGIGNGKFIGWLRMLKSKKAWIKQQLISGFDLKNNYFSQVRIACCMLTYLLLLPAFITHAGVRSNAMRSFEAYYKQAIAYDQLNLYGQCIDELNKAITHASRYQLKEQQINATITLAETLRKTRDYEKAIAMLLQLKQSTNYPRLHVRKLGRIAALHSEWTHQRDSVLYYLDSAITLAGALTMKSEMAALLNEYGYIILVVNREDGLAKLRQSAQLFHELKDTSQYISPLINMLRSYLDTRDQPHADSIIKELLPLLQNRKWYTAQVECYRMISSYCKDFLHDEPKSVYWGSMADKSTIAYLESINSAQVNAFRNMYGTQLLRIQVEEMTREAGLKHEQLVRQVQHTRELIVYLSITGLLVVVVIVLFLREKKLKDRLTFSNNTLQEGNEKYRLLMQESNHRIKNNLQMVISMLQYDQTQYDEQARAGLERMSGKIQTISALHKHLSVELHNQLVPMDTYFNEITQLYQSISGQSPRFINQVEPVQINSERLIYFGLILNEMIVNTFSHGSGNTIQIAVTRHGEAYQFRYTDGSTHSPQAKSGTGTTLIRQLMERVGGHHFIFEATTGSYQFHFYE